MSFVIVENAAYAGKEPRLMEAACHDRTPFITVRCDCGDEMHLHESQLAPVPRGADIASRCHACGDPLILPRDELVGAFAQMRAEGWIR